MVNDKKFTFWRIIVAVAHQDHEVTQEEKDFIISKFDFIDFSEDQKSQLLRELNHPQDAIALFDSLANNQQRAECLHMIHTMFGSDDEFHELEHAFYNRLKESHMANLDKANVIENFQEFRQNQKQENAVFDDYLVELKEEYDLGSGMKRFGKNFIRYLKKEELIWVEEKTICFWRFVVALAHADGVVSQDERKVIEQRVQSLDISLDDKQKILNDLEHPQDPLALFANIEMQFHKAEALYLALNLFSNDGEYCEAEKRLYDRILKYYAENPGKRI
jgi:uncharacterized membrane protein YebE (DUF533 family)